jgi:hypothetical protein
MSQLATWKIDSTESVREALKFHESLNHRMGEQLRALAVARQDRATAARVSVLLKAGKFRWTTPAQAWLSFYTLERQHLSDAQLEEALNLLERTARNSVPPRLSHEATRTRPEWAQEAIQLIAKDTSVYFGRPCRIGFGGSRLPWAERRVSEAVDLIDKVWPEAAADMNRLIRDVVLLTGNSIESSSIVGTFGAIYLCPQRRWLPAYYVESLLHETAHHALYLKMALVDFLVNPNVRARSPFRRDLRPLVTVLEVAFVLARGTHGLARLLESRVCPREAETRRFFVRWREKFAQALLVLLESARWTPHGERLFRSLRDCYAELPSAIDIVAARTR